MEQLQQLDWLALFAHSSLVLGALFALLLLVARYPAAKQMGKLLVTYLLFLVPVYLSGMVHWKWMAITISIGTLHYYLNAFFSQKTRINYWHLIPMSLMVGLYAWNRSLVVWSGFSVMAYYVVLILSKLNNESLQRGFEWFQNPGARLIWLRNFVILNLSAFLLILLVDAHWVHVALVMLLQSSILIQVVNESSFFTPLPISNKYQKSTLNPQIKSLILDRIDEVVSVQKFYLRDDASLGVLAKELGVSTHHLSQVLNESLKISFQDLMTKFRVREACQLLRDEKYQDLKIENIATEVGYNSKSAFNTAFKRRTGLTPSEYRDAKRVQTYRVERLSEQKVPQYVHGIGSLRNVFQLKSNSKVALESLNQWREKLFGD